MNQESELVLNAYEKDRYQEGETKIMWKGIALLTFIGLIDWELFQWFYSILQVKH
jgi:hypothetical protein